MFFKIAVRQKSYAYLSVRRANKCLEGDGHHFEHSCNCGGLRQLALISWRLSRFSMEIYKLFFSWCTLLWRTLSVLILPNAYILVFIITFLHFHFQCVLPCLPLHHAVSLSTVSHTEVASKRPGSKFHFFSLLALGFYLDFYIFPLSLNLLSFQIRGQSRDTVWIWRGGSTPSTKVFLCVPSLSPWPCLWSPSHSALCSPGRAPWHLPHPHVHLGPDWGKLGAEKGCIWAGRLGGSCKAAQSSSAHGHMGYWVQALPLPLLQNELIGKSHFIDQPMDPWRSSCMEQSPLVKARRVSAGDTWMTLFPTSGFCPLC